jgi:hypothetical protein
MVLYASDHPFSEWTEAIQCVRGAECNNTPTHYGDK